MTKKTIITIGLLLILGSAAVFAAAPLRVLVNGRDLQLEPAAQIQDGRLLVPVRALAGAFGASVHWVPGQVSLQSETQIWSDLFDPWQDAAAYEAVSVVNLYLSLLQTAVTGSSSLLDHPEIFSQAVRQLPEAWGPERIWRPMPGRVGSSVCRLQFQVTDGRLTGMDSQGQPIYEIAARLNYYDPGSGGSDMIRWQKVYTVLRQTNPVAGGTGIVSVIDRERILTTRNIPAGEMPVFP